MEVLANQTFNDAYLTQTFTDYLGTGEENAIENRESKLIVYAVNFGNRGDYEQTSVTDNYGENISVLPSDFNLSNSTIQLYWDEECTQAVGANDKIPSYDSIIYAKATPASGYAIIDFFANSNGYEYYSYSTEAEATSAYTLGLDNTQVSEVLVNGVVVADWQDGITLEGGNIYKVTVVYISNED